MIYTETLPDGRTYTYSDTYKIRQIDTGVVYENAVDTIYHQYEETDIHLEYDDSKESSYTSEQLASMTNDELQKLLSELSISKTMNKENMISLIMNHM